MSSEITKRIMGQKTEKQQQQHILMISIQDISLPFTFSPSESLDK